MLVLENQWQNEYADVVVEKLTLMRVFGITGLAIDD